MNALLVHAIATTKAEAILEVGFTMVQFCVGRYAYDFRLDLLPTLMLLMPGLLRSGLVRISIQGVWVRVSCIQAYPYANLVSPNPNPKVESGSINQSEHRILA